MNITEVEMMMYRVMKAIFDSNIPISFKGAMVLKACLLEAGFQDDIRHTLDIDANWSTEFFPSADQMIDSLQYALDRSDIGLSVGLYRMFGESRSAGFEIRE